MSKIQLLGLQIPWLTPMVNGAMVKTPSCIPQSSAAPRSAKGAHGLRTPTRPQGTDLDSTHFWTNQNWG